MELFKIGKGFSPTPTDYPVGVRIKEDDMLLQGGLVFVLTSPVSLLSAVGGFEGGCFVCSCGSWAVVEAVVFCWEDKNVPGPFSLRSLSFWINGRRFSVTGTCLIDMSKPSSRVLAGAITSFRELLYSKCKTEKGLN
jgi:hypothetical protein